MLFLLHCAQSGTFLELRQTEALGIIGGKWEILKIKNYLLHIENKNHN